MKAKHEIIVEKLDILDSRVSSLSELVDSFKGPMPPQNCEKDAVKPFISLNEFLEEAGPSKVDYLISRIESIKYNLESIYACPEKTGPQEACQG